MFYLSWTNSDLIGLQDEGLDVLWTESDCFGKVQREVGFDERGKVCHIFPGNGKFGRYGILDLPVSIVDVRNNALNKQKFDAAFGKAVSS